MKKKDNNTGLIASILFASVVISGSLVFFGFQMQGGALSEEALADEIQEGIELYVKNMQAEQQASTGPRVVSVDMDEMSNDDPVLGDPGAPITIVEFSDYQCPFCHAFYSEALPLIKANYIDKGLVKLVYRDYPLTRIHPDALPSAMAAECVREQAGDEAYFAMHDKMFNGSSLDRETLDAYAVELGVNMNQFTQCMDNEVFADEIQKDLEAAQALKITGTPAFIINGTLIEGAQPFSTFESVIEEKLDEL